MPATNLYWVEGPWPGKLAIAARPRGGEWLADEIAGWNAQNVNTVLSLLTPEEQQELDLIEEPAQAKAHGLKFWTFAIPDRDVPDSAERFAPLLDRVEGELSSGKNVLVHCRQGIGRSALVAACLLLMRGLNAEAALSRLSAARGVSLPETAEQRRWIDRYATRLSAAK